MQAHLTDSQDAVHLPHDGLITAQIRRGVKNKADIETEVVPLIFSYKFDREPKHLVVARGASYEPSAEGALRNDVLRHVPKVEECANARGERALLRGDLDAGF